MRLKTIFYLVLFMAATALAGCNTIGFLLTYKEVSTKEIFRSSSSIRNYYVVNATTLAHCGCTYLSIDNYKKGKKEFTIYYNYNNEAGKYVYLRDPDTNKKETLQLIATTGNDYTIPFDSLDMEIFNRVKTIAGQKPKGVVYPITVQPYKGFKRKPEYR